MPVTSPLKHYGLALFVLAATLGGVGFGAFKLHKRALAIREERDSAESANNIARVSKANLVATYGRKRDSHGPVADFHAAWASHIAVSAGADTGPKILESFRDLASSHNLLILGENSTSGGSSDDEGSGASSAVQRGNPGGFPGGARLRYMAGQKELPTVQVDFTVQGKTADLLTWLGAVEERLPLVRFETVDFNGTDSGVVKLTVKAVFGRFTTATAATR